MKNFLLLLVSLGLIIISIYVVIMYFLEQARSYIIPAEISYKAERVEAVEDKMTGRASWYEITGYCLNKNPMASGKRVYNGAVACPIYLDFGTKVIIQGREYICEDRMALKYRNGAYIDIWFEDCDVALKWGRQKLLVGVK